MVDQPANNAPNFAATKKEPSVKFAAHWNSEELVSNTRKPVSNSFAKMKVEARGFVLTRIERKYYIVLFLRTIANVARSEYFEVLNSRISFQH